MAGLVLDQVPYRMFINYPASEGRRCRLLERGDGQQAQEVEVEWLLPNDSYGDHWTDKESIAAFCFGTGERKRRCTVKVVRWGTNLASVFGWDLMAWSKLSVFEEVVFRVERRGVIGPGVVGSCDGDRSWLWLLGTLRGRLEVALGEGREGSDGEGTFVLFRPSEGRTGANGTGWAHNFMCR